MSKWIFGLNKYFEAALDRLAPRFLVVAHSKILSHVGDPVLESIVKYVSLGDCAVDIGANRGIYTRKLSIQVGRLGEVFAFEPYPPKVRTLRTVCARRKNVRVFDSGVSDRNGFAQLVVPRLFGLALDTLASLGAESPGCSYQHRNP